MHSHLLPNFFCLGWYNYKSDSLAGHIFSLDEYCTIPLLCNFLSHIVVHYLIQTGKRRHGNASYFIQECLAVDQCFTFYSMLYAVAKATDTQECAWHTLTVFLPFLITTVKGPSLCLLLQVQPSHLRYKEYVASLNV